MQPNISDNSKVPGTISNSVSITPAPPLSQSHQNHLNELKVSWRRGSYIFGSQLINIFDRTIARRQERTPRHLPRDRRQLRWHSASSWKRRYCRWVEDIKEWES